MLKHLSICAALIAFAPVPLSAQQQEAVLQKMEVPGAAFDIILAMPKSPGATYNLGNSPDALIVHLIGGELALGFDGEEKMLKALELLAAAGLRFSCREQGQHVAEACLRLHRPQERIAHPSENILTTQGGVLCGNA